MGGFNLNSKPVSLKNMPGPETIHRFELSNGMTLLCMNNENSSSINLVGLLKTASKLDPPEKLGLADFTASMLSRGTQSRSFHQIHDLLESAGASLSFSASTQNTWFSGKSLAEDLPLLLDLSADCLMNPSFPDEYVERLRAQILASLAIREQDTNERASIEFDKIIFPNHPYSNPTDGYPETINAITRDDLILFHHSTYTPLGMILVIVGHLNLSKVMDLVSNYFGKWNKKNTQGQISLPGIQSLTTTIRKHIEIEEKSQTDLLMGCIGPNRTSPDYLPIYLGNDVLGQFGMLGRIGEAVRVQAGLAYFAASSINSWEDAGTWEFIAGVNPKNVEKAINLIIKEIQKYLHYPITSQELQDSQSHLTGRLVLSLESNAGLANAIVAMENLKLGLDYYQRYPVLINSITANQILESSQRYLNPDHLAIVSAGTSIEGKAK
jgi:zinc protease